MRSRAGKIVAGIAAVAVAAVAIWFFVFNGGNQNSDAASNKPSPGSTANPVVTNPPGLSRDNVAYLEQKLNATTGAEHAKAFTVESRKLHNRVVNYGGTLKLQQETFKNDKVSGAVAGKAGNKYWYVQLTYQKSQNKWLVFQILPATHVTEGAAQ